MKKFLQKLVVALLMINLGLTVQAFAENVPAVDQVPSPIDTLQSIGEQTELPSFDGTGQHADAPPDFAQPGVGTLTSPVYFALDIFRLVMSTIAMLYVIITAIKLLGSPTEDEATNAKRKMLWGIVGLVLIQFADTLVKRMFFGEQGEAFEDAASVELFADESTKQIRGIIGFIQIFIGVVAVLVLVIRGFTLFVGLGDEEAVTKAKEQVIYAAVGLVVVGLSEVVVLGFIFPENGATLPRVEAGRAIIVGMTNFLSGLIALFSFVMLFAAGYQYVTAGGNDEVTEKVKKSFVSAVLGLLIAFGAFAFVNTFVKLEARVPEPENQSPDPVTYLFENPSETVYKS